MPGLPRLGGTGSAGPIRGRVAVVPASDRRGHGLLRPDGGPDAPVAYSASTADATPELRADRVAAIARRASERGLAAYGFLSTAQRQTAVANTSGVHTAKRNRSRGHETGTKDTLPDGEDFIEKVSERVYDLLMDELEHSFESR